MSEVDDETVERVARWCAEAGRHAGAAEIRAALGGLSWDELLHAKALLADPPPSRPLGPFALADLARGAPSDVAAEREREGRYEREATRARAGTPAEPPPPAPRPASRAGRRAARARASVVVRRASDRAPVPPPAAPARPHLSALFEPEGRATLERLVRRHGGRRPSILAELAATYEAPEGAGDRELDALLDHHGLARAFAHRERDELLHALRAGGGSLAAAGARVGLEREALQAALARLGATDEAERIRDDRRDDLRRRSTLTDRVSAVLEDEARLRDLGLEAEFEADLRARLPGHLRALGAAGEAAVDGLVRTLGVGATAAARLAQRFGGGEGGPSHASPARPRAAAPRPQGARPPRPGGPPRSGGPRRDGPRSGGPRPGGPRSGGPRPGGPRSGGPRPGGQRPGGAPSDGPRPGGPRPGGPRPGGPRPGGPRPGGPRTGPPRPRGAGGKPTGPRPTGAARPPRAGGRPPRRPR